GSYMRGCQSLSERSCAEAKCGSLHSKSGVSCPEVSLRGSFGHRVFRFREYDPGAAAAKGSGSVGPGGDSAASGLFVGELPAHRRASLRHRDEGDGVHAVAGEGRGFREWLYFGSRREGSKRPSRSAASKAGIGAFGAGGEVTGAFRRRSCRRSSWCCDAESSVGTKIPERREGVSVAMVLADEKADGRSAERCDQTSSRACETGTAGDSGGGGRG